MNHFLAGKFSAGIVFVAALLSGCAHRPPAATELARLQAEVAETERAFARTMAERNHAAFTGFLADDTIFISGASHLRGKQAVADAWKPLYEAPTAPFSWEPEFVEIQNSGQLALSSGPVRDGSGKVIAQFSSIWRHEAPGVWRIIFDRGNPVCPAATP
ncbi:nuclear transport factor 2 family protein [Permianibacter sp. IMCC34836]|uniref:YybH family protein n=1 Tax=Permianibacter fluminis TaxID=2738515 RepID=UPI001552DE14|nr:nuclear transport factor 2 family protein [Permianibacter fluminis]NQD35951.1 nuclear transport factor 2 family protein [Permianibacter fluminis]